MLLLWGRSLRPDDGDGRANFRWIFKEGQLYSSYLHPKCMLIPSILMFLCICVSKHSTLYIGNISGWSQKGSFCNEYYYIYYISILKLLHKVTFYIGILIEEWVPDIWKIITKAPIDGMAPKGCSAIMVTDCCLILHTPSKISISPLRRRHRGEANKHREE